MNRKCKRPELIWNIGNFFVTLKYYLLSLLIHFMHPCHPVKKILLKKKQNKSSVLMQIFIKHRCQFLFYYFSSEGKKKASFCCTKYVNVFVCSRAQYSKSFIATSHLTDILTHQGSKCNCKESFPEATWGLNVLLRGKKVEACDSINFSVPKCKSLSVCIWTVWGSVSCVGLGSVPLLMSLLPVQLLLVRVAQLGSQRQDTVHPNRMTRMYGGAGGGSEPGASCLPMMSLSVLTGGKHRQA